MSYDVFAAKPFFGILAVLTADNLGSHEVGGFKQGFSKGKRKCRHCLALAEDIQSKFRECNFLPSTKERHNYYLKNIKACSVKIVDHVHSGLTGDSIGNEL